MGSKICVDDFTYRKGSNSVTWRKPLFCFPKPYSHRMQRLISPVCMEKSLEGRDEYFFPNADDDSWLCIVYNAPQGSAGAVTR
jgi:hypothetical protein